MNTSTLAELSEGNRGIVRSIGVEADMRRRLMDLGLIENTEIFCLNRSPSGDPTAYFIRGAVIALRKTDTERILISDIN